MASAQARRGGAARRRGSAAAATPERMARRRALLRVRARSRSGTLHKPTCHLRPLLGVHNSAQATTTPGPAGRSLCSIVSKVASTGRRRERTVCTITQSQPTATGRQWKGKHAADTTRRRAGCGDSGSSAGYPYTRLGRRRIGRHDAGPQQPQPARRAALDGQGSNTVSAALRALSGVSMMTRTPPFSSRLVARCNDGGEHVLCLSMGQERVPHPPPDNGMPLIRRGRVAWP